MKQMFKYRNTKRKNFLQSRQCKWWPSHCHQY